MDDKTKLILGGATIIILGAIMFYAPGGDGGNNPPISNIKLPELETKLPYTQTKMPNGDVVLGELNAPVEIVEFSDYQCPFCERYFKDTESLIRKDYVATGKVKIIYKDLIVVDGFKPGLHESTDAALAARCAGDEGKFWEYHDAILKVERGDAKEMNGNLDRDLFVAIAEKLGLIKSDFESCFDNKSHQTEVDNSMEKAKKVLSKLSTPSFLINGSSLTGALQYAEFKAVIDGFLTKSK